MGSRVLIYALSAMLRDRIEADGSASLMLDLLPDRTAEQVLKEVSHPRGSRSLSSHLHGRLGITGVKSALLNEGVVLREAMNDAAQLAAAIKSLPIRLHAPRPIDEAISTAGGWTSRRWTNI